jgi:hypothetical protein
MMANNVEDSTILFVEDSTIRVSDQHSETVLYYKKQEAGGVNYVNSFCGCSSLALWQH